MENVSSLAPYLAGPGAAVIVLLVVLYMIYHLVVKHAIPLFRAFGERHLAQIDQMIASRYEETQAITETLRTMNGRLQSIEDTLAAWRRD